MKLELEYNIEDMNGFFNLDLTMKSGQTSQSPWRKYDKGYKGLISVDNQFSIVYAKQCEDNLFFEVEFDCDLDEDSLVDKIEYIFDLGFDITSFYNFLDSDDVLRPTIDFCKGLRLFLANDPFECIVSSICSANCSISRWTKSVDMIKKKWGSEYEYCDDVFYSFPLPELVSKVALDDCDEKKISGLSCEDNLKFCGVGYRNNYIHESSIMVSDMDLSLVHDLGYDKAFKVVNGLKGVGPKVADCILLYGFDYRVAFPVDVWIKRIVCELFFDGEDLSVDRIRRWGMDEFGEYAGYVQLYLFHYARMSGLLDKL